MQSHGKPFLPLDRRTFLRGSAVAGLVAATTSITRTVWAQSGKVLKVRNYADIDELDPGFYQNPYNVDVMNCLYSKLTRYKPGREWETELDAAEELEAVDANHIRFKLKPGIMFSGDFGEMTAEDVKFSFERALEHDSPVKSDWGPLEGVEVTGKYTGVINFREPFEPVWLVTFPFGVGHIVSKKAVMQATGGGDFKMNPPAFSGPYMLDEWVPNQHIRLKRNPAWTGEAPGYDEIMILPIADEKSAELAYEAGDIDFTWISLASLANYQASPPANTTIAVYPALSYVWLGMNIDNSALSDINLRKAIQYAVNVEQVVEAAYFGGAEPSTGIIAPGLVGHRENTLVPIEGDLDKAREYLEKAGGPPSEPLTIDISSESKWKTMAEIIQAQLLQIGIQTQINVQDSGSFNTLGMESEGQRWKNVQLILNRFSMQPDPFYATSWFVSGQAGIWNWERFRNEEFDQLEKKALLEQDPAKRAAMYEKMQDLMEESGAYRFLTHEATPLMYRNTVDAAVRPDGRALLTRFEPAKS
ncbi:ABC transporter substrate-binding protein [Aurantimonas sp. VKM B-3413]|uniref:ABC transporter substrate-binding protein n=1 Tax=Aurantimonas sp. VKM B-3413 TaxID=2779401 RepID=UPI001E5F45F2|nr:ABC transporter substrate-binding protein [Aurantimonas sp. VKM B-3413]MCB8840393.1 ABC transporter substrate-binding protein [Aurantimonas sp. VKM B-3413]